MRFSLVAIALLASLASSANAFGPSGPSRVGTTFIRGIDDVSDVALQASYLDSLTEACEGDAPNAPENCAPAVASYLDAISTGAAQPSSQGGAALSSAMDRIAGKSGPAVSASPAAVTSYLDSVAIGANAPPGPEAVQSFLRDVASGTITPREAWPTNMAREFQRGTKSDGHQVGYESRKPYVYQRYSPEVATNLPLSVQEVCDADETSEACANAIAAYKDARASWDTNMSKEFSRGRNGNLIGYESRKPYTYGKYSTAEAVAAAGAGLPESIREVCDADVSSEACASAIAKYADARESWVTSMGKEFSRAQSLAGEDSTATIGYASRSPYTYQQALVEACDGDNINSNDCLSAIAAYGDARPAWETNMAREFSRGRDAGMVGYQSRKPYTYGNSALASYKGVRESWHTTMADEFSRGRTAGNTVGYESRKPHSYYPKSSSASSGAAATATAAATTEANPMKYQQALVEACDADASSEKCASAIAAYNNARAAWPTTMSQEFSRGRSNGNIIGYESRKPYSQQQRQQPQLQPIENLALSMQEVCDADEDSEACKSAIAAYSEARESWPTSMGSEFSRGRDTSGSSNLVGYKSRQPYTYQNYQPSDLPASVREVCDADDKSEACASAIAAYREARESWPTTMGNEFSRARSFGGNVIGYESRKPYTYNPTTAGIKEDLPLAIQEVCDADANSAACLSAIASYKDARAAWPTTMSQEFSRGRTSSQGSNLVGYESRRPYTYN